LKAGTAQKLVLNMLSTISMIRLGKTYAGLMVDVLPANDKLRARVRRLVGEATGATPDAVEDALAAAGGEAKVAIVSLAGGVDAHTARERLAAAGGNLRRALDR
jgi:N-acetylmuramic acid 6-phosphate etherase